MFALANIRPLLANTPELGLKKEHALEIVTTNLEKVYFDAITALPCLSSTDVERKARTYFAVIRAIKNM